MGLSQVVKTWAGRMPARQPAGRRRYFALLLVFAGA
jgi:hypothetical protein